MWAFICSIVFGFAGMFGVLFCAGGSPMVGCILIFAAIMGFASL